MSRIIQVRKFAIFGTYLQTTHIWIFDCNFSTIGHWLKDTNAVAKHSRKNLKLGKGEEGQKFVRGLCD
jgi:hypothetical protein